MSEVSKTYEPQSIEAKWYAYWLEQGCFTADPSRVSETRPAYSIVIPPPNVTGVLHLGHVLNNTIQDILARRARMQGKEVLWMPGTDHAGIATQSVVERNLRKEGVMKHRDDLGREALVSKIWEWREKSGSKILEQLRALGASCDWSRTRFTLDEDYSRCVQQVFVDLYKKGLIYRGKRMVNWCPASMTALSDEEVEMKDQNGFMYHFKVEVVEQPGTWLTIATTRPETIPGDSAVAVNPKDKRYASLIGKHVRRPLPVENQAAIPIVGDDAVVFDFGTGVLKVTPAHDKADFEIGQRHNLEKIDIMYPNGVMNDLAGKDLAGLERFAARKRAVELLNEQGAMVKEEPYQNKVGYSERGQVPIEPRLSEQWFLKYPSVEQARECVSGTVPGRVGVPPADSGVSPESPKQNGNAANQKSAAARLSDEVPGKMPGTAGETPTLPGNMRFHPERWAKVYDHWMTGIQDWCISRQLWWGHRVPVWKIRVEGDSFRSNKVLNHLIEDHCQSAGIISPAGKCSLSIDRASVPKRLDNGQVDHGKKVTHLVSTDEPGVFEFRVLTFNSETAALLESVGMSQDPDVLDTWFSSWLWPFATMGWPNKTETLAKFYPTTDLVTGPDILFFWVARMIMAGFEYTGEMPFKNVYFTGIIRDKQGRKLSKSLNNSPDPLDLISKYGADALRFGVMRSAPLGADVIYDEKNVELGRNFCTKLWNAARFRQMQSSTSDGQTFETEGEIDPEKLTSDDKWILLRLDLAIAEVSTALDDYRFSDAAQTLYRFFWSEYCDWYLEASKASLPRFPMPGEEPVPTTPEFNARHKNTLAVMDFVLGHMLRLFHPFMPFITEELWNSMGFADDLPDDQGGKTIMVARWPKPFSVEERAYFRIDETDEQFTNAKYAVVNEGRGLRRDSNIPSSKRVGFVLRPSATLPNYEAEVLKILLNADNFEVVDAKWTAPKGTPTALTPLGELYLPLEGLIDVDAERDRLTKEIARVQSELEKVRTKLSDPNFAGKVPAKVLEDHQQRQASWEEKLGQLSKLRETLG